jgi:Dolichyl-phosphate-mannose-protein mannosyltransferase
VSQGADDNHESASRDSLGLRNEAGSGPGNEPAPAGEQYQSMDLTENNPYEWSDWFSKPKSPAAAAKPVPAEKPAHGLAGPAGPGPAETDTDPAQAPPAHTTPVPPAAQAPPAQTRPVPRAAQVPPVLPAAQVPPAQTRPAHAAPAQAPPAHASPVPPAPAQAPPAHASPVPPAPAQAPPARTTPILPAPIQSGTKDPGLDEPPLDGAEREPVPDKPAGRGREPTTEEREPAAGSAEGKPAHPGPGTGRPVAPPPAVIPPLLDPSPTRPQRIVPARARPQRPVPRFIPAEHPPPPRRSRAAGAPPWVLPGVEGSRPQAQAADTPGTRMPRPRPGDDEPPWPGRDVAEQPLSASVRTEDRPAGPPAQEPALPKHAAPAGTAAPAEKAAPARKSKSATKDVTGSPVGQASQAATYKAPEVVSGAETVMLPMQKRRPDGPGGQATPVKKDAPSRGRSASKDGSPALTADELTTIMPVQKATPPQVAEPDAPEQPYTPSQRRKWISRGVLLGILLMQAVMSLRLHNTAFEDEAQYLYAGRLEIAHLFHGAPLPINFASYFSGAPVLYPVLGAAANDFGGLAAARAVSLLEMLATTALLFAISRRLFNERVAVCASLLFSATASITFLGDFATFDASCLFLLALSSWIMVRTAASRWPLFLLAAPVAALAVATKYAGLLFVPTIAVLPVLTAWPYHRRRVFAYPVIFGVAVAALLYGALRLGGHSYIAALQQTTTSRAQGDTPVQHIGWEFIKWGGLQFGVAVLGAIAYAWRPRTDADEQIAPAGSRLRRILLGLVLVGTALLAPAYQAHIHTDVSFHKHIGFGLFFAAPMAGVGLARIIGDHFRRPQLGIAVWGAALFLGMTQASVLFNGWGSSTSLINVLARQLKPGARYLVEVPEVPVYYLEGRPGAQATEFYSTFVIYYVDPKGQTLTGDAGFEAAITNDYFQVVAYEGSVTPAVDNILASELAKNPDYRLAAEVPDNTPDHIGKYYVWVKKAGSTASGGKVTSGSGT